MRSADFLAVLALLFSPALFLFDLFNGRYLLIDRDLAAYFIPSRFFWVESIKHGSFPLWNPYQFSGQPFFANPQHAMFYPFNALFFLLPFDVAFNGIIMLHLFLGGLFTYLLLRDLEASSTGSLISGLIFMLSGYLLSVHSLLTILLSSVWTPLIMMLFRRAIIEKGLKNEILSAVFITLSFWGGGIEIVYGNFFILLLMLIFSPPTVPRSGVKEGVVEPLSGLPGFRRPQTAAPTGFLRDTIFHRVLFNRVRSLFFISILFLFLSAIQLFPFVELFHHSVRGSGISYQDATVWSFAPRDVLLFFLPDAYGYFLDMKQYWVAQCWFKILYTGGLPFILSLIFFLFGRQVGEPLRGLSNGTVAEGRLHKIHFLWTDRGLYLSLMLFSMFLSLGHYNPLYALVFKYVPFFNGIRYPAKFLYIFILALSITAGLGFERLTELSKEAEHRKYKTLFIAFSLVCVLFLSFLVLGHKEIEHFLKLRDIDFPQFNHLSVNLFHTKRFFFYLVIFFLLIRVGDEMRWKSWTKILLIFFLTADLFGNMGFYGKQKSDDFFRKTKILEIITGDKGNFRTFSTEKTVAMDTQILATTTFYLDILKEKHPPSMRLPYLLHDIWGIDVIRVKRGDDLYNAFTGLSSISATNLVDLYGIKYVISVAPIEGDPRFEMIFGMVEGLEGKKEDLLKQNTIKLYKNRKCFARVWLVKDFKVLDSKTILSMMTQKGFDPGKEVFLEEEPKWINPPLPPFTKGGLGGLNEPLSGLKNKGGLRGSPLRRANDVGELPGGLPEKAEIVSESNNRLYLQVMAAENALLVLSDTYYPGWKAFVNGKETKIYRADYAFRAIPLNAGTHQVEFVYDPMSFKLGAGVTLLGILGCVVFGWTARRRRKAQ